MKRENTRKDNFDAQLENLKAIMDKAEAKFDRSVKHRNTILITAILLFLTGSALSVCFIHENIVVNRTLIAVPMVTIVGTLIGLYTKAAKETATYHEHYELWCKRFAEVELRYLNRGDQEFTRDAINGTFNKTVPVPVMSIIERSGQDEQDPPSSVDISSAS